MQDLVKVSVTVPVDGELVGQEVYMDSATGLDVDPLSGVFRTRSETEELIAEVYRIGRDALPKELERYNAWVTRGSRRGDNVLSSHVQHSLPPTFRKVKSVTGVLAKGSETENCRERGNEAIKSGDFRRAVKWYSEGLIHEPSSSALMSNRAAAKILLGRSEDALSDAEMAISFDSENVKAYYRKSTALCMLGERSKASTCVGVSEKKFGSDLAWESLNKRIEDTPVAVLVGDRWVCSEDVEEGKELCALETIELPSENFLEVLKIWRRDGIPEEILAKETSYYSARGTVPMFEPFNGIMEMQKINDLLIDEDLLVSVSDSTLSSYADILRWSYLLSGMKGSPAIKNKTFWAEPVFDNKYIVLGASLFFSLSVRNDKKNVTLRFDQRSKLLHVTACRHIAQYETLYS
ncbi:putative serine/threonine protein phosphatase type 5 [Trypanosoma theileri]|uniref:Putative serine/threonine protein phosphatase type 5 n=1 Tax=Trypanosoma theileri TaxID=67003 RepID=A0A1X0NZZ1_9TRYP|nr:putative serine/threonine protein phosphatase type 5 [Trypanosoma theileri]ORC90242.1 putative serine/threonine protein phosphatase type 5 [Trypanosoma theileri]